MDTSQLLLAQAVNQNSLIENSILGNKFFNPDYLFSQGLSYFLQLLGFTSSNAEKIISTYHTILFFLALFFFTVIFYCVIRMFEIRRKEHQHLQHEIAEYAHRQAEKEKELKEMEEMSKNERWVKTLHYLFSQHMGDWKLAVIEADSMLEELVNQLGFKGENLGEKLKAASHDNFRHLNFAWEAHAVRNRIAHEGTSFEFPQREAKRVIALYEQIFRDYDFI